MFSETIGKLHRKATLKLDKHVMHIKVSHRLKLDEKKRWAKAVLMRKWLWGFVTNRAIANQFSLKDSHKEQTAAVLLSFINELNFRQAEFGVTFKSILIHKDKYRELIKRKPCLQTQILEAIISECERLSSKPVSTELG